MCDCEKPRLYDAELSAALIQRPKNHEEANSILMTVLEKLQHPIIKKDMELFIANASLAEKTNFLNSRAYQLPPADGHTEADHLMEGCEQVCEDVCRMVCRKANDHDPASEPDCHDVCHKVCSCAFNQ